MRSLNAGALTEVAVLGAHCDDIEIGMGATLLTICRANPGVRVKALVLTGGGTDRETEQRSALVAFCPDAAVDLTVLGIPDGRTPSHWEEAKEGLKAFRRGCDSDIVFATQRGDAHQDHRLLAELAPTEFRDHPIFGYEILKWEADTPRPTVFHPIDETTIREKSRLLHQHYQSQVNHDWFDEEAFVGLARLRGVQCHRAYAEAFLTDKTMIEFGEV